MSYLLLTFAAGILTGMFLPPIVAWVMSIGEHDHASARRKLNVDQILAEALPDHPKPPVPRQRNGRHSARH